MSRKRSHTDVVEVLTADTEVDVALTNGSVIAQKVAKVDGSPETAGKDAQTYSLTVLNTTLPESKPTTPKPKPRTRFIRKSQGVSVKYMCYDATEKVLLATVMDTGTPMCKFSPRGELLEKAAVDAEDFTGLTFCIDTRRGVIVSGGYGKLQVLDKRDFKEQGHIKISEEEYIISVAYCPTEDAYLVGDLDHNLWYIDAETREMKHIAQLGDNVVPYHLCHNEQTSEELVCDSASHKIHIYDKEGKHVRTLGSGEGSGLTQFHNPQAGCIDREGHLLVPDYYNHRVLRCPLDGSSDPFQVIVTSEQLEGGKPSHVTLADDGTLFVASNDTSALFCFDYLTD